MTSDLLQRVAPVAARPRLVPAVGVLAAVLVLAAGASLLVGSRPLPVSDVWNSLRGNGEPAVDAVVRGLRVPRTVLAVVVGAALGLAGALTQALTRNPLADPGLVGVNAGASLGVVVAMAYLGVRSPAGYVWCGVLGAVVVGAVVLGLTSRVRSLEPVTTLVLTGSVVSALLGAATTVVLLLHEDSLRSFQFWSAGTLAARDLGVLTGIAPVLVLGVLAAAVTAPALSSLELGDDLAAALGRRVRRDRAVGLAAVVLLAAAATAAAGTLGFLGLLAPHLARFLAAARPVATLALSALTGAVLLTVADVAGRVLLSSSELPVGIVLAVLGAPVFVALARRLDR
ncbi:iron ABC transporter permease [Kineococcus endophyticus]|uniref:Iron ABC transporter permease n=1 Tax=Kineococcus endophyticus TaxID=1181883 RepID=A0ABV3PC59_9ACTN